GPQRAAPQSSTFPPTEAPLQTLHMDVKGDITEVLIDWIRGARRQLSERFGPDLSVLRLHSDRGGEFSSDLLRAFCRRRIGMVMDVARTSMIHAAAPHFLWPFAVQYATHQINLQPCVSLPETTPTLRWTGKVGDAFVFRVWGSRAFVHNTSADKLSSRAVPCVFLCFPPDAPGWQFYHPTSRRVLSSQDVTIDESVSYYHPAEPVEVAVNSGAVRGTEPAGAGTGGAETGGAEPGGAEPERVEPGGVASGGAESGGAEPERVEPEGIASGSAEPACAKSGGALGVPSRREPLSPQQFPAGGAAGAAKAAGGAAGAAGGAVGAGAAGGAAGATGGAAGGAGGAAGAGAADAAGCTGAVGGPRGARTGGTGAAGTGGGAARPRPYYVPLLQQVLGLPPSPGPTPPFLSPLFVQSQSQLQPASPLPGPSPYSGLTRGLTERREPESCPVSPESRSESPVRTVHAGRVSRPRPPPVPCTQSMTLRPSTAPRRVPLPSPPESSLSAGSDPEPDSLRAARPTVTRFLATTVTGPLFESTTTSALVSELVEFAAACRLHYATSLVAEFASASVCPPSVGGECALGTDVLEDRLEEFECFVATVPHLVSMLLAPGGDPDAPDIPTPRSYAEAIEVPYSSQWQAAMDAEMASWKVKRPPGSPPVFKARYVARGFSQRQGVDFFQTFSPTPKMTTLRVLLHVAAQRDYELHSFDFSIAFLQGSLHEEIWLRRPPSFTGSFPAGTQWSLRRPVYGLRQAPREWHDTLRTTLAALGFAPSTADPSLILRTDTTLPPFYVLVYVDDLVFATADTEALAHMKSELQKRHTCTDLGPSALRLHVLLTTVHSSAYRSLVLSSTFRRVLRWAWGLCLEDGLELSPLVTLTLPGSSCEAEIYAGAMAAQELRWLTYLLTDFREAPRSPPVLYRTAAPVESHRPGLGPFPTARVETCVSSLGACVVSSPCASEGLRVGVAATNSLALAFVAGSGATSQSAQISFTLDSGASSYFFRDFTDLTPLRTPVTVALAAPSVGPVVAHSTTTLPCPAAPSGFLTGYYTPSFSKSLVGVSHLHDLGVITTFSLDEPADFCTDGATGAVLATFHRELGSGLYSLHTRSHRTGSGQVRSGSCCVVRLSVTHPPVGPLAPPSRSPVVPTSQQDGTLPSGLRSPIVACTNSQLAYAATLHLDIWGPSLVLGPCQEHYFLIVVDNYSHYTTVFPLRRKSDVPTILEPWLLVRGGAKGLYWLCLHSDRGGEFSSTCLETFCSQGVAADFRIWGSLAHIRAPGANKLSLRTLACVFLDFPLDASGWVFYDPVTYQFFASQEVTFDESVCYYRSRPHRGTEVFSPPLFLTLQPPPVAPVAPPPPLRVLPRQGSGAAGAGGVDSGGAGGVGVEVTPRGHGSLDSAASHRSAGSGCAGAGGTSTVVPTPRTVHFLTREQRLLRSEREGREWFERAQQQQ
ncbi:unnamed protein product, partial [Closterium sp. NIES-53]